MKKPMNQMDKAKDAARERETREFLGNMRIVKAAIMVQIEEKGQKNMNATGLIDPCPICETGQVSYSRAGRYNGHITAQCSTADCIGWIE